MKPIYMGSYPAVLRDGEADTEAVYIKYKEDKAIKLKFFGNNESAATWVNEFFIKPITN